MYSLGKSSRGRCTTTSGPSVERYSQDTDWVTVGKQRPAPGQLSLSSPLPGPGVTRPVTPVHHLGWDLFTVLLFLT